MNTTNNTENDKTLVEESLPQIQKRRKQTC